MPYKVRQHERRVASGKTTTVRQHEREGGTATPFPGEPEPEAPAWWMAEDATATDEDWWTDVQPDEREADVRAAAAEHGYEVIKGGAGYEPPEWAKEEARKNPVPDYEPPPEWESQAASHTPAERKLFGTDTPEGAARYDRGAYLRDIGYTGPIDQDGYMQTADPACRIPGAPPVPAAGGHWWEDPVAVRHADMLDEMRAWRDRPAPVPAPEPPMAPALARALGCDTPEGIAKYERLRAYREAGYNGPLDQDNQIPDPDDPGNYETVRALARLSET